MDIYEDIDNNSEELLQQIKQLQDENKILQERSCSLEADIEKLCKEIVEMKKVQENLTRNISSLYKTAKTELDRKDRMISDLRKQVEELTRKPGSLKRIRQVEDSKVVQDNAKKARQDDEKLKNKYKHDSRSRSRERHYSHDKYKKINNNKTYDRKYSHKSDSERNRKDNSRDVLKDKLYDKRDTPKLLKKNDPMDPPSKLNESFDGNKKPLEVPFVPNDVKHQYTAAPLIEIDIPPSKPKGTSAVKLSPKDPLPSTGKMSTTVEPETTKIPELTLSDISVESDLADGSEIEKQKETTPPLKKPESTPCEDPNMKSKEATPPMDTPIQNVADSKPPMQLEPRKEPVMIILHPKTLKEKTPMKKPEEQLPEPGRVLRSTTKKTVKNKEDLKLAACSVNLMHDGEIPVLHISDFEHSELDLPKQLISSSPIKSDLSLLRADLNLSLEESKSEENHTPASNNVSNSSDYKTPSKRRRRVVLTMID